MEFRTRHRIRRARRCRADDDEAIDVEKVNKKAG
jgi:hypothetical protein